MWWSAASLTLFLVVVLSPPLTRKDQQYGVSAQLYTNLDYLAHVMNLPLKPVNPTSLKKITCLAKIPEDFGDDYRYGMEGWDYYRTDVDGNFNNKYFCANVPNPKIDFSPPDDRTNVTTTTAGIRGPHSLFWLNEPSSWHWHWRWTSWGSDRGLVNMLAKENGILFVIEVTGIKSRGRFLKGWFHLKITLDIDQNLESLTDKLSASEKQAKYVQRLNTLVVDKLMVTARGRTLLSGRAKPAKGEDKNPPRRAWVGGIGQFVKDFPPCKDKEYNNNYVTQQFMDCPNAQLTEAVHGNNFYYTRTEKDVLSKYGQTHNGAKGRMEIHLNYKLDNSLCNKYYDLDFVANGIVSNTLASEIDYPAKKFVKHIDADNDKYLFYNVQRSVSTRFVFSSSHGAHFPTFYENADPIPRGVDNVDCGVPLAAEWEMNHDKKYTKQDYDNQKPQRHRVAVTRGADLKLINTKDGIPTDASFGGAIKFIYDVPSNLYDFELPPTRKDENGADVEDFDPDFTAHRTFTYQDRLMLTISSASKFHKKKRNEDSPYIKWVDKYEYPQVEGLSDSILQSLVKSKIIASVQRVLNEFDWETWRANDVNLNPNAPGVKDWGDGSEWCKDFETEPTDPEKMKSWPHPYYDATCFRVDAQHVPRENLDNPAEFYRAYTQRTKTSYHDLDPDKYDKTLPVIIGRCKSSLFASVLGGANTQLPMPCDFFFEESRQNKTLDPALQVLVKMTDAQSSSGRKKWHTKYLRTSSKERLEFECSVVNKLREEFPDCPILKPRPYTPRPINPTKEDDKELKEEEEWERNKAKEFLKSNSYKRGMLAAEDPFTLYIWDSRLIHGIFMTIITMCCTPISIFMTRYFKETFMDSRIFLHRIWFFIHISASFMTALLFLVGMWRQTESRGILGVSLSRSAVAHRIMGWISVTICLLLVFFGAFRCMEKMLRAVIIIMHSFMGILFYILCLACMITANAIPGSPAAYNDFTVKEFSGGNLEKEGVLITVIIWIIFDIGMHTAMTILQCMHDRNMKLTSARMYLLSPMPILTETERFDAPGRFARIYMLTAYIAVAILGTVTICFLIFSHSPREKGLGFMSCTHQFKNNTMREEYDC